MKNPRRKGGRNTPHKLSLVERRRKAAHLRMRGMFFDDIAKELGISVSQVWKDVAAYVDQVNEEGMEDARQIIAMEAMRIDRLIDSIFDKATAAKDKHQLGAIDRLIKLMERKAKLFGLDKAQKVEAHVSGPEVYIPAGKSD